MIANALVCLLLRLADLWTVNLRSCMLGNSFFFGLFDVTHLGVDMESGVHLVYIVRAVVVLLVDVLLNEACHLLVSDHAER